MSDPTTTIIKPPVNDKGFGRRIAHDLRDANYRASVHVKPLAQQNDRTQYWFKNPLHLPLDQGYTPQCVAFSAETLLYCGPIVNQARNPDPHALYHIAQVLDEWAGEDYDGTSVRAGQKALQQLGFIQSYLWAYSAAEAASFMLERGPVIFGTAWTDSMMEPVKTHGDLWLKVDRDRVNDWDVAGHAYCAAGVDLDRLCPDGSIGAFQIINSWGKGWGANGRAWISFADANALIQASGECALPTEIKVNAAA